VRLTGLHAARQAVAVRCPVLVLQGQDDPVAQPKNTRLLLDLFPTRPLYREVAAGHDIVNPATAGWAEVEQGVRQFAAALLPRADGVESEARP
jgi:pimeloyl-ACP methyl ester carboxylesterase